MAKSDFHNIWQYCEYALEGIRTLNSSRTQDFRTTISFDTHTLWFDGLESIFTHSMIGVGYVYSLHTHNYCDWYGIAIGGGFTV